MKIVLLIALGIMVIAVVMVFGCATTRKGYESAKYTVVVADESTEVRDYPALIVAETPMPETGGRAQNSGFMSLFRYISGNNERQQSQRERDRLSERQTFRPARRGHQLRRRCLSGGKRCR